MDIDLFYEKLAAVLHASRFFRSSIMHVSIPQDLDRARGTLKAAGISQSEATRIIQEQLGLPDTSSRVSENNLEFQYIIYDRPVANLKTNR